MIIAYNALMYGQGDTARDAYEDLLDSYDAFQGGYDKPGPTEVIYYEANPVNVRVRETITYEFEIVK